MSTFCRFRHLTFASTTAQQAQPVFMAYLLLEQSVEVVYSWPRRCNLQYLCRSR